MSKSVERASTQEGGRAGGAGLTRSPGKPLTCHSSFANPSWRPGGLAGCRLTDDLILSGPDGTTDFRAGEFRGVLSLDEATTTTTT